MIFMLFVVILPFICGNVDVPNNNNLAAVIQIFRHGERTPLKFFKGDPYMSKKYWGGLGTGQLTQKGKRQQYDLGKFTRNRYSDFIPETYDESFITVRSTHKARTYMSAQCTVYGLFPAIDNQTWLENQDWQPIPVYEVDPRVLNDSPNDCRGYLLESQAYEKSEGLLTITEDVSSVLQYISNYTGDNVNTTNQAYAFYQALLIEEAVGLKPPEWTKRVYPEPLGNFSAFWSKTVAPTPKMQKFYMGAFLKETITFFNDVISGKTNLKYLMFSAHDLNLIALLQICGALDRSNMPWFTSSLWIELRRSHEGYYINVWYKNKENLKKIQVAGCSSLNCSFNSFKSNLEDVLFDVNDWEAECAYT